ncbi:MAG: sigma-70 family RNA polymerase sigma factor [Chloroflexota bacterium]
MRPSNAIAVKNVATITPSQVSQVMEFDTPGWSASIYPKLETRCTGAHELGWSEIYDLLLSNRADAEAYSALSRRVARWADRQLTSPPSLRELREDVVAHACSATVMGLDQAYGADTFAGFVYGQFLSARRRYLRLVRLECVPIDGLQIAEPTEHQPAADELALLQRCLMELTPRERSAVELRYFANVSSREIGQALGVTEVNARRIVFNGLAQLRRRASLAWPGGREGS